MGPSVTGRALAAHPAPVQTRGTAGTAAPAPGGTAAAAA
jgi:hypothetical protein